LVKLLFLSILPCISTHIIISSKGRKRLDQLHLQSPHFWGQWTLTIVMIKCNKVLLKISCFMQKLLVFLVICRLILCYCPHIMFHFCSSCGINVSYNDHKDHGQHVLPNIIEFVTMFLMVLIFRCLKVVVWTCLCWSLTICPWNLNI
jgi:Mg2+/citrate symporter